MTKEHISHSLRKHNVNKICWHMEDKDRTYLWANLKISVVESVLCVTPVTPKLFQYKCVTCQIRLGRLKVNLWLVLVAIFS